MDVPHARTPLSRSGAGVEAGSAQTADALLLRRRVLSVDDYAAERRGPKLSPNERARRFGSSVAPVPVPLGHGESEQQYEARFVAWLAERAVEPADLARDANRERSFRMSFAEHVARDHAPSASPATTERAPAPPEYITCDGLVDVRKVPRRLTLVHEYTSLEQFKRDSRRGRFFRLAKLSYEEKYHEFGSPYAPIYVPLAPGETPEMYEQRFETWLVKKRGMTLRALETHHVHIQERYVRMQFATLNAKGQETFILPEERKRERQEDHDTRPSAAKKPKEEKDTCAGQDSVDACRACGCRRCLLGAMRLLATAIFTLEGKANARRCVCRRDSGATEVMDRTQSTASCKPQPRSRDSSAAQETTAYEEEDAAEQQLLEAYETQNELVVMNENALADSAAGLVELAASDVAEATRRRDEDDEMRELIQEEIDKRSAALATLLVYMYRSDLRELNTMVNAPQASDVVHVQRIGYHKCLQLAVEIAETGTRLADGKQEGSHISELEEKLDRLREQRRRELVTLVYFDQRVRELIRVWLARIHDQE